jgi:hypothetical protein
MKILLVSIPNHHFFQWANQLKESGYEVYWFDITDGAGFVEKINWVKQFNGWKLKWDYPFRHRLKIKFPKIYTLLERIRTKKVENVFEDIISKIQPDVVHCFEMKLAGLPILSVMQQNKIPFVYSSWGSDMFYFEEHGVKKSEVQLFLKRVDYFISDCKRDYTIAVKNGFKNQFLGIFPGNGGVEFPNEFINAASDRKIILIKGYESFGCKASKIVEALQFVPLNVLQNFKIVFYSADEVIIKSIRETTFFNNLEIEIYPRLIFVLNKDLLKIMGKTAIHISNNISDGMPNTLLESMGMGAFPIQSNPGNVSAEVIEHGVNGYLIDNPLDSLAIAKWIEKALTNLELRAAAQLWNVDFIPANYNREKLQAEIIQLYRTILQ